MCSSECLDNLIINLKVLGKISAGSKINTKEKYLEIDSNTWGQAVIRWIRGDNRKATCDSIHSIISSASHVIQHSLKSTHNELVEEKFLHMTHDELLESIHKDRKKVKRGVASLKDTYIHDTTLSSKLEIELGVIQRQIDSIEEHFQN